MSNPFKSLNAATTPGAGASKELDGVCYSFTLFLVVTGSPTEVKVRLEFSQDGTNWVDPGQYATWEYPMYTSIWGLSFGYVKHVRAYLMSITGGSSPTVTAFVSHPNAIQ